MCAMAAFADDAVGNITKALKRLNMWDNTIVILVSDNGGPTHLDEGTWSSNFPLRVRCIEFPRFNRSVKCQSHPTSLTLTTHSL